MTIDDVRDMGVDRFCAVIKVALEAGQITGKEAFELISEFWKELKHD
ncbi:MAG: hypothetical protein ACTSRW_17080 [Candidatus Helarchaeota archaeon]